MYHERTDEFHEIYDYYGSSNIHEISRLDTYRISRDLSSDSEDVKYEKWKAYERQEQVRERMLKQQEQLYDELLSSIKCSYYPEGYSFNILHFNYQDLRNGRTREKLETIQRERRQELHEWHEQMRERILKQQEQLYDDLLSSIKCSDNPEGYSFNILNFNYQDLRNGRTREKLEIIQRERCQELEKEIRNILVIGCTGNGKSTLCNVLVNKDNELKEIFEESDGSTAKTRNIQSEVFKYKGIKYRIIDTIGFGDTKLKPREVILSIAESYKKIENGLTQIFFVTERFTLQAVEVYEILKKVLFDENITDYITIVKTKFSRFKYKSECEKDIQKLEKDSKKIHGVIESCNKRIIYVDNPQINEHIYEDDIAVFESNKKKREESRKILLNHLENCQKVYKSKDLDKINEKIDKFAIDEIEKLRKKLRDIQEELCKMDDSEETQSMKDEINEIGKQIKLKEQLLEKTILSIIGEKIDELLKKISECKVM
ncbi:7089_t:CDS:1 [Gigaspora margarita]|uniref:7089_t:CDS:1 n=1 Tax=Gigaspora margarita TaxID=4874 RepID=A0ABN7VCV7_GIGMA|nr:7089_t:CDS:1 [Gigaspora margarita]